MSVVVIETPRTTIRPYAEEDIERILPIFSDPTTMQFWPQPLDEQAVRGWVTRAIESYRANGHGRMLVEDRADGAVIGDCGIALSQVNGQQEYDLGYIFHHPYWRQGYALECARAVLDDGIARLGLRRVVANMAHDHAGSRRVAEKLGMRRESEFHNTRNRNLLTYLYVWEKE